MPDSQPNIVLIITDQQRGDCLGIDGHPVLQTPNLDSLAATGSRFRRAASECPSCIPARRSLMTGTAPAAQGMVGMTNSDWDPPHTLAGCLRDAGYQTALIGKLHLQPLGKRFGFEYQELADGPYERDNHYIRWLAEKTGRSPADFAMGHGVDANGWVGRPGHLPEDQTMTWWCMEKAIDFLRFRRDPTSPFFLNISLFDPHPPLVPPQWYYDRYINRELPAPAVGDWATDPGLRPGYSPAATRIHLQDHHLQCLRAAYYATINFIDDQVGRLLQYMRREGLARNTLFLFTSDHGEMLGDHHLFRKCWPYEGSTRVPMLIHPPAAWNLTQGVVSDGPVGLQDVMPTLLDAAGAAIPAECTGKSLLPVVRGQAASVRAHLHVEDSGTYTPVDGYHMLLGERYKYVWYSQRDTEHLFDLQTDPQETHDLALGPAAAKLLNPWRKRMIETLSNRPEGFVQRAALKRGAPHTKIIPNYQPDKLFPYL